MAEAEIKEKIEFFSVSLSKNKMTRINKNVNKPKKNRSRLYSLFFSFALRQAINKLPKNIINFGII